MRQIYVLLSYGNWKEGTFALIRWFWYHYCLYLNQWQRMNPDDFLTLCELHNIVAVVLLL